MRRFLVLVVCVGAASITPRASCAQEVVATSHSPMMSTRADSLSALHARHMCVAPSQNCPAGAPFT